jgi:hypothetical protein
MTWAFSFCESCAERMLRTPSLKTSGGCVASAAEAKHKAMAQSHRVVWPKNLAGVLNMA